MNRIGVSASLCILTASRAASSDPRSQAQTDWYTASGPHNVLYSCILAPVHPPELLNVLTSSPFLHWYKGTLHVTALHAVETNAPRQRAERPETHIFPSPLWPCVHARGAASMHARLVRVSCTRIGRSHAGAVRSGMCGCVRDRMWGKPARLPSPVLARAVRPPHS